MSHGFIVDGEKFFSHAEYKEAMARRKPFQLKIYKNKNYTKRDYEVTNVVACIAESAPNDNWIESVTNDLGQYQHLFTENHVKYYGYL